jgi:hypothetical protein
MANFCALRYQRLIRHRFIDAVKSMYIPPYDLVQSPRAKSQLQLPTFPDNRDSAEIGLLHPDDASLWSEDAQHAITDPGLATLDPNQHLSSESKGSSTSSELPSIAVVLGEENHGEFEMTERIPRPRASS